MAIAAIGQICSTASIKTNIEQCITLIARAAAGGAKILFLPEASDYIAPDAETSLSLATPQNSSAFVTALRDAAEHHSVAVHVGIHAITPPSTRMQNRALYIAPSGIIDNLHSYDKLHVFDYGNLKESNTVQPGTRLTPPFASPVGRIGSLICFDLRFPETGIALAQPSSKCSWYTSSAEIITYPSAFTVRTGEAHWETLLRARAIETQSWIVAAAQVGKHNDKRASYGNSLVVDPWGEVKLRLKGVKNAEGDAEDGAVGEIGFVDLDLSQVARVRKEMPLIRRMETNENCKPLEAKN